MISKMEYYKHSLQVIKDKVNVLIEPNRDIKAENEDAVEILWSQQTDLEMLSLLEIALDDLEAQHLVIQYIWVNNQDVSDYISNFVERYFECLTT